MPRKSQSQNAGNSQYSSQSQNATQLDTAPVIQELKRISEQALGNFKKNLEFVQVQLKDVASTFADDNQPDKVQGLRASVISMLNLEHEVRAYLEAMSGFTRGGGDEGYVPDATKATNFSAKLEEAAASMLQGSQFDISRSLALQDFDDATNNMGRTTGAGGDGRQGPGADDDDDIVMGGGKQELLNNKCPITQKSVLELDQPVEDQHGYIYESEAIKATLANFARRGQACACPIAGTAHTIGFQDLRPSDRVKRARRRAMLQRATQGGNTQQQQEDVYDV